MLVVLVGRLLRRFGRLLRRVRGSAREVERSTNV